MTDKIPVKIQEWLHTYTHTYIRKNRFRYHITKSQRRDTHDFTNDLTRMHRSLAPLSLQQYLENIPACTPMLFSSFEWKENSRRFLLYLPFFYPAFLFSVLREPAASSPCIAKRNTYFVLAHSFAFDGTRARGGRTAFFFFNSRSALSKDNTTKQLPKILVHQTEPQISSRKWG